MTEQRRLGLNRPARLDRRGRCCVANTRLPALLVHLDIKKLGRFARVGHRIHGDRRRRSRRLGFVHVALDDGTRVAYAEVLPREDGPTTAGFWSGRSLGSPLGGVDVQALLTDNGTC